MGTNGWVNGRDDDSDSDGRFELRDVVEPALARALMLAAEAGRWELVERIAAELRARRKDRTAPPVAEPRDAGAAVASAEGKKAAG